MPLVLTIVGLIGFALIWLAIALDALDRPGF